MIDFDVDGGRIVDDDEGADVLLSSRSRHFKRASARSAFVPSAVMSLASHNRTRSSRRRRINDF